MSSRGESDYKWQCIIYFMNADSRDLKQLSGHAPPDTGGWGFLTNHAHVLLCVAHDPGIRLRDIAAAVGITERSAHKILSELVDEGYVLSERHGRRNRYKVKPELPLRHPLVQEREVGDLLNAELHPQIDQMTDEEAAQVKLIFAPEWPSKETGHGLPVA